MSTLARALGFTHTGSWFVLGSAWPPVLAEITFDWTLVLGLSATHHGVDPDPGRDSPWGGP